MLIKQRTIKHAVSLSGVGLHTGNKSKMTFKPAPENHGVKFKRIDLENSPEIPADIDHVIDISRGTTIGKNGVEVHTVEHVLSAIMGCEIDNIVVELDANEPPVMDGSAKDYVHTLHKAGIEEQDAEREYLVIEDTVHYHSDDGHVDIVALPLKNDFRISLMIDFQNPALGVQHSGLFNLQEEFEKEFAPARTFCFLKEIEMLVDNNLIKGGTIDNAVVIVDREFTDEEFTNYKKKLKLDPKITIGDTGILNDTHLRFKNEPARHKVLDLIGDLALIGAPIKGQILAARPGHKANVEFTKMLRKLYLQKKNVKKFQMLKSSNGVLDIEAIMKILPHRYPFLLVDRILDIDIERNVIIGLKNVTFNEPFFMGHFPVKPIMPGVLIVEAMAQCGGILLMHTMDDIDKKLAFFTSMDNVKFKKQVVPGDQLVFEMEVLSFRRGFCKLKGKAYKGYVGGELAAEGEFSVVLVDRQP
ncbi:MAG: bifunctional UDP-3-O-[3-hydroxymyristoyl] N-acetylglucosamine deacetylase/3-hydroxyacyl-ACP dehydratase [Ignavibacteriota bacterium]|nr:bifunctional UDP-3-O-[3-hydroxymyristoyl] N-acetylglucosamine deacetylase/3-hydroxyacyl-ACP dehydratase [Ignavibacteriota bacterium]